MAAWVFPLNQNNNSGTIGRRTWRQRKVSKYLSGENSVLKLGGWWTWQSPRLAIRSAMQGIVLQRIGVSMAFSGQLVMLANFSSWQRRHRRITA
jgi:hypothetical protein